MAIIDEQRAKFIEKQKAKLFEVYGLIEKLILDDKGERILELYGYLDNIVKDYNGRGNLTHLPLINLFKLLIEKQIQGYKLLELINRYNNGDAVNLAKVALQAPDHFNLMVNEIILTPKEIKERAKKSLEECLDVI